MIQDDGDFHSSAFILGPDNTTALIRDMRKANPLSKFAGGKKQLIKPFGKKPRGETPLETLIREIYEETGLRVRKSQTMYVTTVNMGNHNKHYFFCRIPSFRKLVPLSKEYEEARVVAVDDLVWLPDFHPNYRAIFLQHIQPLLAEEN